LQKDASILSKFQSTVPLGPPTALQKQSFNLGFLSADLDHVRLSWICCREVAALGLSRLGCVTVFVYVPRLLSSPLKVPEVSLHNPAQDGFFLPLSRDLDGGWLFRIHWREVAALG